MGKTASETTLSWPVTGVHLSIHLFINNLLHSHSPFITQEGAPVRSQQFILPQMHSLNYVSTIVKYSSDILCVYCTREVRIAIVTSISARCADSLKTPYISLISVEHFLKSHVYPTRFSLDIMLIPNCTSGKDVYILVTDNLNRGRGTFGPINLV